MKKNYLTFKELRTIVLRACNNQQIYPPSDNTLRNWLNNKFLTERQIDEGIYVESKRTDGKTIKYEFNSAKEMLKTSKKHIIINFDHDIKKYQVEMERKKRIRDKLVETNSLELSNEMEKYFDDKLNELHVKLILKLLLKTNGYKDFNDENIINDLWTVKSINDPEWIKPTKEEEYLAVQNLKKLNLSRYLKK